MILRLDNDSEHNRAFWCLNEEIEMSSFQRADPWMNRTQMRPDHLLWAAPLTTAVSMAAVLFIGMVAVAFLKPDSSFQPLTEEV